MYLADQDKRMLDGQAGEAAQEAMEFLVLLGEAVGAERMVDLHSAHLFADWHTVGEGGLEIYEHFVELGAKVQVPTTDEPISIDPEYLDDFNLPADYPAQQAKLLAALRSLGVAMTHSCIIHLNANIPKYGENLAWIENNATGWANSVIGARANREGAITCLMAAITGRIPQYGLLEPRNRKGEILIELDASITDGLGQAGPGTWLADYHALGMAIGDIAYDRIPVITGLPPQLDNERLKALCAMCSPAYTDSLLLMVGVSPEAPTIEAAFGGSVPKGVETHRLGMDDVRQAYDDLQTTATTEITGVLTGCPFKTIYELQELADLLEGRKIRDDIWFWVTTDPTTRQLARESGIAERIERSGAKIYAGTCQFCQPVDETMGGNHVIASDSMKMIRHVAGPGKPKYLYGTLRDCIDAAVSGKFVSSRW